MAPGTVPCTGATDGNQGGKFSDAAHSGQDSEIVNSKISEGVRKEINRVINQAGQGKGYFICKDLLEEALPEQRMGNEKELAAMR